ncbi:WAT1-related protein At5g47470-like [Curcuma longa]|uniref:WAT1-related protein At5g47470-like n=1 Tax=Curcuma longa TaxID=136217 RepID=UPI003D9E305A
MMISGMKITSPAIASAMPNLSPGIIFIVAVCLRFERFDIKCWYTRVKILGNIVCIGGAVAFSIYQNPSSPPANSIDGGIFAGWFIGCLCLFGAVLMVSFATIMQAATLIEFPAPISLCAFASLLGAVFTAIAQLLIDGKIDVGTSAISCWDIIRVALTSGAVNSACIGFISWSVKEKGPVFVCVFSPVQTVSSAILTAVVLGQSIGLKSIVAMFLMFCGLYEVLWAKTKEDAAFAQTTTEDIQEPLLLP